MLARHRRLYTGTRVRGYADAFDPCQQQWEKRITKGGYRLQTGFSRAIAAFRTQTPITPPSSRPMASVAEHGRPSGRKSGQLETPRGSIHKPSGLQNASPPILPRRSGSGWDGSLASAKSDQAKRPAARSPPCSVHLTIWPKILPARGLAPSTPSSPRAPRQSLLVKVMLKV